MYPSIVLVVTLFLGRQTYGQGPVVNVSQGQIVGRTVTFSENKFINVTKDVDVFQGIPYANPPERFKPPTAKAPWSGSWDATAFKPACTQTPSFYFPNQDEDCLYLNVYAPNPKPSGAAVMVYIHGGGFSLGTAMVYDYYGVPLAAVGDVIIVTINYRLGVFAMLTTRDEEAPGNIGMLDQVAALQWVQDNINAFGGDPNKVTIFGESAGSASVSFHLLSKLSEGLFDKAIMQSGTAFSPWAFEDSPKERQVEIANQVGLAAGCDVTTSAELVECLRTIDADQLRAAADTVYQGSYPVTVDGTFLDDTPSRLYEAGDVNRATILGGVNKDEGTYYVYLNYYSPYAESDTPPPFNMTEYERFVLIALGDHGLDDDITRDAVLQEYTDWTQADNASADFYDSVVHFGSDLMFICPTDLVLRHHATAGDTVYQYQFAHEVTTTSFFQVAGVLPFTPWLAAGHAEELVFVWGWPFIDELYSVHGHNMSDGENALSVEMMRFWTNFAKTGDPSKSEEDAEEGEGDLSWPPFTVPELRHKVLDVELGEGRALRAAQCHFWNEYVPQLLNLSGNIDDDQKEWRAAFSQWKSELEDWRVQFGD